MRVRSSSSSSRSFNGGGGRLVVGPGRGGTSLPELSRALAAGARGLTAGGKGWRAGGPAGLIAGGLAVASSDGRGTAEATRGIGRGTAGTRGAAGMSGKRGGGSLLGLAFASLT